MRVARAGLWGAIHVVASTVVMLALYKLVRTRLGADGFGVWALVMSFAAAARLGDLGVGPVVTREMSVAHASRDDNRVAALFTTGLAVCLAGAFAMVLLLMPVGLIVLRRSLPSSWVPTGMEVYPSALGVLVCGLLQSYFLAVWDAHQKFAGRVAAGVASQMFILLAVYFFGVSIRDVIRVQLISSAVFIVGLALVTMRVCTRNTPFGRPDAELAGKLVSNGIPNQVASLATLLFDPVTKLYVLRFGSLADVGLYEMATRIVVQARSVAVGAAQTLIPKLSVMANESVDEFNRLHDRAARALVTILGFAFTALWVVTPFAALFWLRTPEPMFEKMVLVLLVGWFASGATSVAYFANISRGHYWANGITQLLMCGANIVLGAVGGMLYGPIGVVAGWSISLIVGSWYLTWPVGGMRRYAAMFRAADAGVAVVVVGAAVAANAVTHLQTLSAVPLVMRVLTAAAIFGGAAVAAAFARGVRPRTLQLFMGRM